MCNLLAISPSNFGFDDGAMKTRRYSLSPDDPPTYPGPTIIASKNCSVQITFHNILGPGQHLFPIDRSTNACGTAMLNADLCAAKKLANGALDFPPTPEGEDDQFYCRCVSPHGFERRATVQ